MPPSEIPDKVRALFLSDLHLGYRLSNASKCVSVLNCVAADRLYLVGDLLDTSRMSRQWYWPAEHQQVVDKICDIQSSGTATYIMPGNHDECFRDQDYFAKLSPNVSKRVREVCLPLLKMNTCECFDFETLSGKLFLITHGDLFDTVDDRFAGIPKFGSRVFDRFSWIFPNRVIHWIRGFFKLILARPGKIESAIIRHSVEQGYDGVVFGHLHRPVLKRVNGFIVANPGDWMENQSFLVETLDGELMLINEQQAIERIVVA
jgi:UDP-2,3-diacylglucosamine pyrophosphatase LpxH